MRAMRAEQISGYEGLQLVDLPEPAVSDGKVLLRMTAAGVTPLEHTILSGQFPRPAEKRLALGRAIVDICVELLGVPRRTVMVEFTPHPGEEILREGNWVADWTPAEAVSG